MLTRSNKHIIFTVLLLLCSCDESKTVVYTPQQQTPGTVDQSTLLPQIQYFYPGTLQTLDVPYPYPTDIPPDSTHMILVFSDIIENRDNQMNEWISLTRNGSAENFSITPNNSSYIFEIVPDNPVTFSANYSVFISSNAHKKGDDQATLNLSPLVQPPATTINPPDSEKVEYTFETGITASSDFSPPSVLMTDPINGENNVEVNLTTSDGSIVIIFNDNANPMINPLTVDNTTITLTHVGFGPVSGSLSLASDDYNFKRYNFTPNSLPLVAGSTYLLTISVGNAITDFSGNSVPETTSFFSTAP